MNPEWNLKEVRQTYGLSQGEIAEAINKSRATVASIENGDRTLTAEELGRLADFLGVEIQDLLSFEIPDMNKYKEMLVETLRRYYKYTGKAVPKTFFAKLIYFVDFAWFYENLRPMSGMKYRRDTYGPVPDQFFRVTDNMVEDGELDLEIKRIPGRKKPAQLISLGVDMMDEPNQYLAEKEIELIDKVVRKWQNANTDEIVNFTHRQMPWQVTRPGEFIPYELITQEEPDNVY